MTVCLCLQQVHLQVRLQVMYSCKGMGSFLLGKEPNDSVPLDMGMQILIVHQGCKDRSGRLKG